MGNFERKIETFINVFIHQNGYTRVLEGLQNTLLIAVSGLIIGIIIGTLIATVRVIPNTSKSIKWLLRFLCWLIPWYTDCSTASYLLLRTSSTFWNPYDRCRGFHAGIWSKQWSLCF